MSELIEYEDLFQDRYIFESIGKSRYYDELYPDIIKERNNKKTRFIKYALNVLQGMRKQDNKKGNLLFLEHKFIHIAKGLSDDYNIYLLHDSLHIYKSFRKENYYQYFYRIWLKLIDKSYITHDMQYAFKAMKKVQSFLRKNKINIVFTGNDKMFMEKLVLIAAKRISIPTVVIQHGAYTDEWSFGKLKTADTADNFWSWSEYIKDCYIKRYNKKADRVKVIGYPFELLNEKPQGEPAVLFLGNNYRNTNYEEGIGYLEVAKNVLAVCDKLGIQYNYRAHPAERIDSEYGHIAEHIHKGNSLLQDIEAASIVIGDVSSAMVEAGLCKRKVIQIIWSDRSKETLNDPLYGFTIKIANKQEEIEKAIQNCMENDKENQINEYYMYKDPCFLDNIKKYVLELITEHEQHCKYE